MAVNEVYKVGAYLSLPVPAGTKSGDAVRVGAINAVAQTDAGVAANGSTPAVPGGVGNGTNFASCALEGVFRLNAVTGALTVGQLVYITGAGVATATATGNKVFGKAIFAKAAGTGPATVKITDVSNDTAAA